MAVEAQTAHPGQIVEVQTGLAVVQTDSVADQTDSEEAVGPSLAAGSDRRWRREQTAEAG